MSFIRTRIRLATAVVALGVLAASCGSADTAAEVDGGETLTGEDVSELLNPSSAAQVGDTELSGDQVSSLTDGVVDKTQAAAAITTWVRVELFFSEMADRGYEPPESLLADARAELEVLAETNTQVPDLDTFAGELAIRSQALGSIVGDFLLNNEGVEPVWPVQLCSSHILLDTEEEAVATIARLDDGEDFAVLAAELSTGPSGPTGGDLGCVDPASFVPAFTEGAALVDAPGISDPVQSDFGWHVISVRSFGAEPSDDPAVILQAVLTGEESVAFQDAALARDVTIDPAFGEWDSESATVVNVAS